MPFTILFDRWPVSKEFIKFSIVGISNISIDFLIYLLLTRETVFFSQHLLFANILSFIVASFNSYYWNKSWTFRDNNKNHRILYTKFLAVSIGGLIIAQLIFFIGVHYLNIYDILVKILASAIAISWNFLLNKLWTFTKKQL